MRQLPFPAALLSAAMAIAGCSSTQDVLNPSAIAAAPPAAGSLAAEGDAPQSEFPAHVSVGIPPHPLAGHTSFRVTHHEP